MHSIESKTKILRFVLNHAKMEAVLEIHSTAVYVCQILEIFISFDVPSSTTSSSQTHFCFFN